MRRLSTNDHDLDEAVALLRAGKLVAFPTETVYGLGGDAANADAVRAIFAAKGRPADHPVIVHLPNMDAMEAWADPVPEAALRLAGAFWPGPLTLVLPRAAHVNPLVTGGQDTIGLRVPSHPVAEALLERFGGSLAAPSANRFGHVSPTTAAHVQAEFGPEVAAVVDGGACDVGLESTIVDLSAAEPRLLRPGMIHLAALESVLGRPLVAAPTEEGPRAPGRLPSHYAPRAPLRLVGPAELAASAREAAVSGLVAVLSRRVTAEAMDGVDWRVLPETPERYARVLYATLRDVDVAEPTLILVERVPDAPEWRAIGDRLARAAT